MQGQFLGGEDQPGRIYSGVLSPMSRSNWLQQPKTRLILGNLAVGLLIVAASVCFGLYFWPDDPPSFPQRIQIEGQETFVASMEPECVAILARRYELPVDPKQTEECADKTTAQKNRYRDLVQGIRAANAAEEAAWLAYLQTRVGVGGAILVVLTLCATGWAAVAAGKAANAAQKSVAVAASVERPYVYVSNIELKELPEWGQQDPEIKVYAPVFVITNYGRTPAIVTRIGYGHALVGEADLPDVPVYKFSDDLGLVIRPNKSFSFPLEQPWLVITGDDRRRIMAFELNPRIWGQVRYRDFLGGMGETGFVAFQYPNLSNPDQPGLFRFRGPPAYTYYRYREDGSDPS